RGCGGTSPAIASERTELRRASRATSGSPNAAQLELRRLVEVFGAVAPAAETVGIAMIDLGLVRSGRAAPAARARLGRTILDRLRPLTARAGGTFAGPFATVLSRALTGPFTALPRGPFAPALAALPSRALCVSPFGRRFAARAAARARRLGRGSRRFSFAGARARSALLARAAL